MTLLTETPDSVDNVAMILEKQGVGIGAMSCSLKFTVVNSVCNNKNIERAEVQERTPGKLRPREW